MIYFLLFSHSQFWCYKICVPFVDMRNFKPFIMIFTGKNALESNLIIEYWSRTIGEYECKKFAKRWQHLILTSRFIALHILLRPLPHLRQDRLKCFPMRRVVLISCHVEKCSLASPRWKQHVQLNAELSCTRLDPVDLLMLQIAQMHPQLGGVNSRWEVFALIRHQRAREQLKKKNNAFR